MVSKILLVEDDPAVREVIEQALSREGMQITETAADGEEALGRLSGSDPFDLVVLDLTLAGGMDGFSVCQEIRAGASGEAKKDVPVIMLTARDDETSVVVGLEVSADDYISKPFRPRDSLSSTTSSWAASLWVPDRRGGAYLLEFVQSRAGSEACLAHTRLRKALTLPSRCGSALAIVEGS